MKKVLLVVLGVLYGFFLLSQNIGIHTKPLVWLRSDLAGDSLGVWKNIIPGEPDARAFQGYSFLDTTLFNFHKSFLFSSYNTKLYLNIKPKASEKHTLITVYKASGSGEESGLWHIQLDSSKGVNLSTQKIGGLSSRIKYSDSTQTRPIINTFFQSWREQKIDTNYSRMYIGGTDSSLFRGKFAEFLVFDKELAAKELNKVHSYLAIRYGISLVESDYVDSRDSVLWSTRLDSIYSHDIAAIGRDSLLGVNQKQSSGSGGDDILAISAGKLSVTNSGNPSVLQEGDFLIWGHNSLSLEEKAMGSDTLHTVSHLPKRTWLMVRKGNTANTISTSLRIDCSGIDTSGNCYLVINREAREDFPLGSTEIYSADSTDSHHRFYFSDIQWDTDGSGRDMFSFLTGSNLTLLAQTTPSLLDTTGMKGAARLHVYNGVAPFSYALVSEDIDYSRYWTSSDSVEFMDNLTPGVYTVEVTDIRGKVDKKEFEVFPRATIPQQLFASGIHPSNPGNSNAATLLYPNPTKGEFKLEISFDKKTDYIYRVRDMRGVTLKEKRYSGSDSYIIQDTMLTKGSYMIEIESSNEKKIFKLVVN